MKHHAVYRMYDADGVLLYVGMTVNIATRLTGHRDGKDWWPNIANITLEHHSSRDDAALAEQTAIRDEKPLHNGVRYDFSPLRSVRIHDDLYFGAKTLAAERGETLSEVVRDGLAEYVSAGEE